MSSRLKGDIHSLLPGAPRHCNRGTFKKKKKAMKDRSAIFQDSGTGPRMLQDCRERDGLSCSVVAIPVAFVCLLLHSRLTASQRWKQSQIRILEALRSGEKQNILHSGKTGGRSIQESLSSFLVPTPSAQLRA